MPKRRIADHDERRHDRAADEELGDVHDAFGVRRFDAGAWREPQLAVGDDALAGCEALCSTIVSAAVRTTGVDRPRFDGHVRLDDEHVVAAAGRSARPRERDDAAPCCSVVSATRR